MHFLYNIFSSIFNLLLPVIGLISPKLKLFANGRKETFDILNKKIASTDAIIWFHCASLGEYEQGVPVMEALKIKYPKHKLLVTFFSPSGFEVKKNSEIADVISYLPIDTANNARKFIDVVQPDLAVFVKYEFWPNYLKELEKKKIPSIIISAAFRENQIFFKKHGSFMRNTLKSVAHFFVQDEISKKLLEKIKFNNVTISGDTRFDRVAYQIEMDNKVDFISEFVTNRLCVVIGSSWKEDEEVFIDFINRSSEEICFIIAPHEIKEQGIKTLFDKIEKKTVLYSNRTNKKLDTYQVFIADTVGYLSRIYSYGDIAYVGGGMGTSGLHNILEPATFGMPIVIGKNFDDFREAKQLQKLAGLFSITTKEEFNKVLKKLVDNKKYREQTGMIAGHFINSNTGATDRIMTFIDKHI